MCGYGVSRRTSHQNPRTREKRRVQLTNAVFSISAAGIYPQVRVADGQDDSEHPGDQGRPAGRQRTLHLPDLQPAGQESSRRCS